jgi:hypothetical protein
MGDGKPYNPLDYDNLTLNVVRELMSRGPYELPIPSFGGPGVYALFYRGDVPIYQPARSPDATRPIYVGKAVLPGARKGGKADKGQVADESMYPALWGRLREHSESISAASSTLRLADFVCRYMTVVPLWITMAERFLIEHYRPVWNTCIDGFGLHDPGKGRYAGEAPWWDVLHPGRRWATKLKSTRSRKDAERRVREFFEALGPTQKIDKPPL